MHIKPAAAYVTSLSDTCENTFAEDQNQVSVPEQPSEPAKQENDQKPEKAEGTAKPEDTTQLSDTETGDNSRAGWYALLIVLGAGVMYFRWKRKRRDNQKENK